MITNQYKLILDNYLLEIYDSRYRRYIILDEEYFDNLKDRLSRTSVSTLNGRIMIPPQMSTRSYLSNDRKRKRTSSFSPQIDYLIIWLDSYIGHPDNCRYLLQNNTKQYQQKSTITTETKPKITLDERLSRGEAQTGPTIP
ncbi:unnamed protein product, partial [Rotaria sp. Silwood2]